MGIRKRLLCALLSAAMLMDMGGVPVSASSAGSDIVVETVSETQEIEESASQSSSTVAVLSAEGSYAYYDNNKIALHHDSFAVNDTVSYSVKDAEDSVIVSGTATIVSAGYVEVPCNIEGRGTVTLNILKRDAESATEASFSVQVNAGISGSKGNVKEYPNGKVQAEDLQETSEMGITGKILLVYADAGEMTLSLIKNSQDTAVVDLSEAAAIHHVAAVDYRDISGTRIYGGKRQLVYQKVSLGVPKFKSVSNEECKFTITWEAVPYASEYIIYRTDAQGNPTGGKVVCTTTSYTYTGIQGNMKYYYVVAAAANGRSGKVIGSCSEVMTASPTMKTLAKVPSFKALVGDTEISLSWGKVTNATKYIVQQSVTGSDEWKVLTTTTGTSYKCSNLTNGKTYSFRVRAVRTVNGYTIYGSNASLTATPKLVKPVTPTGLTVTETSSGNKLTWKSSGKVTGFIIYLYNYNKGKYERLAVVNNATSYIHKGTKSTERYKYAVRAYRTDNGNYYQSGYVEKLVFGKKLISSTNSTVHPLYYTAYTKKKVGVFKTQWETSSSKYIRVLKKGTKVTVIRLHATKPKIRLADGTEGYTYRGALRLSSEHYTAKQYTTLQAECFVNQKGFGSSTKYLIWVATYTQRFYVFKGSKGKWTLVRSGQCATGAITNPDYPGEKKITSKTRWHYYGKRFYQYLSGMNDGNVIHTRPAYRSSGRYVDSRLGRPLSHGCIRVTDSDGAYIYKNCGKNTKVVIY